MPKQPKINFTIHKAVNGFVLEAYHGLYFAKDAEDLKSQLGLLIDHYCDGFEAPPVEVSPPSPREDVEF